MSKVTLTIDYSTPEMVAAFGDNAASDLAYAFGYTDKVRVPEDQLPAPTYHTVTDDLTGEEVQVQDPYTQDQLFTDNPLTPTEWLSDYVIENGIVPLLLKRAEKNAVVAAQETVKAQVAQMSDVLKAQITKVIEN